MEVVTRPKGNAALSGGQGTTRSFDLNSWKGLTEVLKAARESGMDPEAYGDFRDKVLSYAQSGGDTELKGEIDAVLNTLKSGEQKATAPAETESGRTDTPPEEVPEEETAQDTAAKPEAETNEPESAGAVKDGPSEAATVPVQSAEPSPKKASPEAEPTIGHARPTPTFGPPQRSEVRTAPDAPESVPPAPEQPTPKEEPAEPTTAPASSGARAESPHSEETPVRSESPASKSDAALQKQKEQEPAAPKSDTQSSVNTHPPKAPQAPEEVQPARSAEPVPSVAPQEPEPVPSAAPQGVDTYKQRIIEIKRDVNARVGNPVTLIDAGNEVGREYMNALLRAMRATAGGNTGDLSAAMGGLETAYRKIMDAAPGPADEAGGETLPPEETLQEETPTPAVSEGASADAPTPVDHDQAVSEDEAPDADVPSHSATPEKITVMPSAARQGGAAEEAESTAPDQQVPRHASNTGPTPTGPVSSQSKPTPEVASQKGTPKNAGRTSIPSLAEELSGEKPTETNQQTGYGADTETASPKTEEAKPGSGLASEEAEPVARAPQGSSVSTGVDDASPHSAEGVEGAKEKQAAPTDELHTEEVNAGLDQLLNEWKLFNSSGFFGTGPGGMEHPLYKKLAPLSMSSIIGGRFEKAEKDVVQSIKDYTNAWRHEQGISYTPSETFEHYLRRVVARILKRQRN